MPDVPYINYHELEEFYTISEICKLFRMSKGDLKQNCKQHSIEPRRNEIGDFGFVSYDVRKLHNKLYYEDRSKGIGGFPSDNSSASEKDDRKRRDFCCKNQTRVQDSIKGFKGFL